MKNHLESHDFDISQKGDYDFINSEHYDSKLPRNSFEVPLDEKNRNEQDEISKDRSKNLVAKKISQNSIQKQRKSTSKNNEEQLKDIKKKQ